MNIKDEIHSVLQAIQVKIDNNTQLTRDELEMLLLSSLIEEAAE
jgi:hypothetical protein